MQLDEAIKYLEAFELCTPYTLDRQGVYKTAKAIVIKAIKEQQSCEDCVSRRAVVQWLENATDDSIEHAIDSNLEFIPSVTPTSKEGKWINGNPICPCCGENKYKDLDADCIWADWQPKYCPNCGARLESGE